MSADDMPRLPFPIVISGVPGDPAMAMFRHRREAVDLGEVEITTQRCGSGWLIGGTARAVWFPADDEDD